MIRDRKTILSQVLFLLKKKKKKSKTSYRFHFMRRRGDLREINFFLTRPLTITTVQNTKKKPRITKFFFEYESAAMGNILLTNKSIRK